MLQLQGNTNMVYKYEEILLRWQVTLLSPAQPGRVLVQAEAGGIPGYQERELINHRIMQCFRLEGT